MTNPTSQPAPTWTIHQKSCLTVTEDYEPNTFAGGITSAPYKEKDGYTKSLIDSLAEKAYLVTKPRGLFFSNFASLAEEWDRPAEVNQAFLNAGWLHVTTIIWVKSMVFPALAGSLGDAIQDAIMLLRSLDLNSKSQKRKALRIADALAVLLTDRQVGHYTPIEDERRLNNLFEFVEVWAKEELPELDRWSEPNGVPYADKSNLKRGNRGKRGDRHCSGNVWFLPYKTRSGPKTAHPHEYPEELVERCLALAKFGPGDTIFEPFCGGGTTIIAAVKQGVSAVGYELNPATAETARARIEAATKPSPPLTTSEVKAA